MLKHFSIQQSKKNQKIKKYILSKITSYSFFITLFFTVFALAPAFAASLPDFTELAKKSGPAVVNISTEKLVSNQPFGMYFNAPKGHPLEEYFEQFQDFFNQGKKGSNRKEQSLGSGFIISSDGFVVTNNHVIEKADTIRINFDGKQGKLNSYKATIVGTDPETDLALLKIDSPPSNLPYMEFGDSDKLEVGEWVIAIGNPFGLDNSVTAGIISAKGRNIQAGPFDSFLQTDASINPGNSGGPLLNQVGEVIGINTAIIASGQGIGFAIPSNIAKNVIEQLKINKKVRRGWLGVQIQDVNEATANAMGLKEAKGALVGSVIPGEPAEKAGLQAGDIILKIDDHEVNDNADLLKKIAELHPNAKVNLTIWRKGTTQAVQLTLGERNSGLNQDKESNIEEDATQEKLGLKLRNLKIEDLKKLGLESKDGVLVISVDESKVAAEAGLKVGDVIISANLVPVKNLAELEQIIKTDAKKRGAIMFNIIRNGQTFFVAVPFDNKK